MDDRKKERKKRERSKAELKMTLFKNGESQLALDVLNVVAANGFKT
jgi:hypothetical protein